ncbi:MAG: ammonia-forming cytochrome c nitrite reductase subunit c552 [Proteobacteria bacterium]|nr:ammonia-forming cytochrome c nitrite reductase subunit c552 [Pseudomonadota bacterium]MBU1389683.1 ammonia-forming cytochrome c nitrite reductase subunit c552 [Pseudomonadota bacterium]MBU1542621.1 ammonia-forming cytochrome c nitrite reductase subunit c552 [Pseudomonadota bacterium]MBU2431338.1 ammonia-forming cytochrome c nitrite reductase subunit c552 [Pseudomonadota bacterium]MBU2482938.1 ammonia-forming cytochrome c nitrite reductase subunit c552 [Pseudomonadota bacterium]
MVRKTVIHSTRLMILLMVLFLVGCDSPKPEAFLTSQVSPDEYDPKEWGKAYPLHYESWLKTKEAKPAGKSRYKKGWDDDKVVYDKLSEFPFLGLLYQGWGFGIEYNEPRGHYYAVTDQFEIDPSRVSSGGVCLACKTPFHRKMTETHGLDYLKKPYLEAVGMLPEGLQDLGPACYDCHLPDPMTVTTKKAHLETALAMINKTEPSRQELRTLACAQCHVTYSVPRDENMKTAGDVVLPWKNATWGDISIEGIIADLLSDPSRLEWTQKATGFKMPFIRHPEFEVFSRGSVHFNAGVACADCHMPFTRSGGYKISDHNVTSPLKADLRACLQCHTQSKEWLTERIFHTQDRTASLVLRAGYNTATCARLFQTIHTAQEEGTTVDSAIYNQAKDFYMQAFLRLVFVNAENSTGFHNPAEAGRILGDAIAFSGKSEALLRQLLAGAGMNPQMEVELDLGKTLNNRGQAGLNFRPEQEFKDPFGVQEKLLSEKARGL